MKKLLIFLFLCISLCTNAQEYIPVLKEGRTWVYLVTDVCFPENYFFRTETVSGDTIIDGVKYKKDYHSDFDGHDYGIQPKMEEEGKVYSFYEGGGRKLLMDFNMHTGDTYGGCAVMSEDSIVVRGIKRRRLKIRKKEFAGYWVEGIGSSCGDAELTLPESSWGATWFMYECYDNGELIFTMKDFDAPTVTGINTVTTGENADNLLYDINGMRVETPEKGKMYIRNGKKFVK